MKKKWIASAIAILGVAASIATILAYIAPRDASESPPTTSVQATGDNSIAAGNDVRIGERTVIDKHDFNQDRAEEAQGYLKVARETCKSLSDRITAMTADSQLDLTQMQQYNPPELYPPEVIAEHYGEQVYTDISSKLKDGLQLSQAAIKPLTGNAIRAMTGIASRKKGKAEESDSFAADKKAWLDNTNGLCAYLNSI